jgi:hypothetical protein
MARRWPSLIPDAVGLEPAPAAIHRYLLDADDDLATEFDVRTRLAARPGITVKVLRAAVGDCHLAPTLASLRHGYGLLILDGLIALDMRVGDRTATELVGAGDLLAPSLHRAEAMLERHDEWRVLVPASLALLDADFATRVRPWPQIAQTLLRRASRRTAELDEMRAIACHPRLEVRLDLLFWHLAARWGRVEPTGIKLTLPLTHRLLGQLVAAERPSISHALGRLSGAGLVTGCAGDWHLHGSVASHQQSLASHTLCPADQTRGHPAPDRARAKPA